MERPKTNGDHEPDPKEGGSLESELELRIRAGDETALAEFFGIHGRRLRQVIATRMDARLKGRLDPSDVLQEAYIDLAHRLPNFVKRNDRMSVFVWMRLVATERILVNHRKHLDAEKRDARRERPMQAQRLNATSLCLAENMLAKYSSVGNRVIKLELRKILMETLDSMDPIDQEIIIMRNFEGLSNSESAESLGISKNGASNRFVRAMARLRSELKSIPGFMD